MVSISWKLGFLIQLRLILNVWIAIFFVALPLFSFCQMCCFCKLFAGGLLLLYIMYLYQELKLECFLKLFSVAFLLYLYSNEELLLLIFGTSVYWNQLLLSLDLTFYHSRDNLLSSNCQFSFFKMSTFTQWSKSHSGQVRRWCLNWKKVKKILDANSVVLEFKCVCMINELKPSNGNYENMRDTVIKFSRYLYNVYLCIVWLIPEKDIYLYNIHQFELLQFAVDLVGL